VELVRLDSLASASQGPSVVTLGNFDGVHLGHQALVAEVVDGARAGGSAAVVLTFDPHPARVLSPGTAKSALMTLDQKAEVLGALGVDRLAVLPFTESVAQLSAEAFARLVLREGLGTVRVVVGQDFRFGRARAGNVETLARLGESLGFGITIAPPVLQDGIVISSSRVRDCLAGGEVARARSLLGRPFYVDGAIVTGEGRGRTLGFPTANVAPRNETLPRLGVYACRVRLGDGGTFWPAVANLGRRPTFGGSEAILEAHLLDFDGDLYGSEARVQFVEWLRPEKAFAGPLPLLEQIRSDIAASRRVLENP
jgi:riboflavin kinase/FMN adenylyltransferase